MLIVSKMCVNSHEICCEIFKSNDTYFGIWRT